LARLLLTRPIYGQVISSTQDGKVFHNKAFFHYGNSRRGLLLLTEAPPHELEIPRQAPGDVDIAFESDVRIKSFVDLMEAITKDVAGGDAKDLLKGLDEKLPGTSLPLRQVLDHLDTRMLGILRVDPKRSFVVPSKGQDKTDITIPGIDLLLSIDNLAMLYDALAGSLGKIPGVTAGLDGDLQFFEIDIPIPGAAWLKPVLAKDRKSGRLTFATSRAFIKEYMADKTAAKKHLAAAPDFKKATDGFQSQANSLTYMSGAFLAKLADFVRPFAKGDAKVQTGIDVFFELLPEPGIPCATEQVNLPDGLFHASNATTSHKSTIFPGLVAAPLALVVAGVAVMVSVFKRSLANQAATAEVSRIKENIEEPSDGFVGGTVGPAPEKDSASPPPVNREIYRIKVGKAPSRGGREPKVTIVEFTDFQCQFCSRAHDTMNAFAKAYGNDVRLVFKHNPLPFHDRAMAAALAAEAANEQGKFWAMHDKLFTNQQNLGDDNLENYAREIGLDMARFRSALNARSKSLKSRIAADQDEATRFGMTSTPNFLINGRALRGAYPMEMFKAAIDDEIKKADEKLRKGVACKNLYAGFTKNGSLRAPQPKGAKPQIAKPVP
jgi:protein-disulfide isomerase